MTDTTAVSGLSPGTAGSYTATWDLFVDWCGSADQTPLPADPATVLDFVTECPAAPATQRRRVIAIDHHHTQLGYAAPGENDAVRAVLGRPPRDQPFVPINAEAVEATLRLLPSSGWTAGVFGRRDRCLLVLSQLAGVPYQHIASLTAADLAFDKGTVAIAANGATYRLSPAEDPVLCPTCAVARWLEVLDVAVREIATVAIAQHLRTADTVTPNSPHPCRSWAGIGEQTKVVPLLAPIDQWGSFPFPLTQLSAHAVSRQTRDMLAGHLAAHRDRPVPAIDQPADRQPPAVETPVISSSYSPADWSAAVQRRRADLARLAEVADDLAEVERRAGELNTRVLHLLENGAASPDR